MIPMSQCLYPTNVIFVNTKSENDAALNELFKSKQLFLCSNCQREVLNGSRMFVSSCLNESSPLSLIQSMFQYMSHTTLWNGNRYRCVIKISPWNHKIINPEALRISLIFDNYYVIYYDILIKNLSK